MRVPERHLIPLPIGLGLALLVGVLIGVRDYNAEDVQLAVLLILAASVTLTFLFPKYPWAIAICVGLGVPIVHIAFGLAGRQPAYPNTSPPAALLLPLVPALIGAYGAWLARGALLGRG